MTDVTPSARPEGSPTMDIPIRIPDGLLGFPDTTDYRLVDGPGDGLFWLLADDGVGPSFLLSDPFTFFEGYSLVLSDMQSERIEATRSSEVAVMAITTPGPEGEPWTANLRGPVVINVDKALGAQMVLTDESAGLRRSFTPDLSPVAA